jgi:hypothetical protein
MSTLNGIEFLVDVDVGVDVDVAVVYAEFTLGVALVCCDKAKVKWYCYIIDCLPCHIHVWGAMSTG